MSRLENFLRMYRSKKTVATYRWALNEFFKTVYGENEGKLEQHAERYFTEKRDVQGDIESFFVTIKEKPPKSVRLMLAAVRTFLVENDVELPQKFWRHLRVRIRGSRALTLDRVPSNVELRRILMHMPIQGKALYLMLASGGMRIGETLQLKLDDVEFNKRPGKVNIRGKYTKTGNSRVAFVSKEAVMAVQEWLKTRKQYLIAAVGKSHKYTKSVEDDRLFPFLNNTAYAIWKNAVRKAGFLKKDKQTNRHTLHPHVLRKFFRTRMGTVIPVDVAEALMGHEQYLTEVYRRYTAEDLAKFYLQGESALLVFTEAEEVGKLRAEVEEREKRLQSLNLELQSRVSKVELENTDLKGRIRLTEQKLEELVKLVREKLEE